MNNKITNEHSSEQPMLGGESVLGVVKKKKRSKASVIGRLAKRKITLRDVPQKTKPYFIVKESTTLRFDKDYRTRLVRIDEQFPTTDYFLASRFDANLIPKSLCLAVHNAVKVLMSQIKPNEKARVTYCVGDIKHRKVAVSPLVLTGHPKMQEFINNSDVKHLIEIVSVRYKQLYPREYNTLKSIPYPSKGSFGCFSGMAINVDKKQPNHTDKFDWKGHPSSAIIAISDFEGGELLLPDYRIGFQMKQGNTVFLRSGEIWHHNSHEWKGQRITMVLFVHNAVLQDLSV